MHSIYFAATIVEVGQTRDGENLYQSVKIMTLLIQNMLTSIS